MKQISVLLVGVLAMLATSCGFKSEEKPLTDNLITYTAEGNKEGEIFLGVKAKDQKDKPVIVAANYTEITADENVIICAKPDGTLDVYTLNGNPVGNKLYNSFIREQSKGKVYYTGFDAKKSKFVYFPDKNFIRRGAYFVCPEHIFIEGKDEWDVYTFDGSKVWSFKNDALVIKDLREGEVVVAILNKTANKKKVTGATIYSTSCEELKKLNAVKWKLYKKKLSTVSMISTLQVYLVESLD